MDGYVEWAKVAQDLSRRWVASMNYRSKFGKLTAEDLEDFLLDLWIERCGDDELFLDSNRGRLHNYCFLHLANSNDISARAPTFSSLECDDEGEGGNLLEQLLTNTFSEDEESRAIEHEVSESISHYWEQIEAICDDGFARVLAELFDYTDRSGRTHKNKIQQEKIADVIFAAAKQCGVTGSKVKALAQEIIDERTRLAERGHKVDLDALSEFAEIFGLRFQLPSSTKTTAAKTPKQKSAQQKRQKLPPHANDLFDEMLPLAV